MVPRHHVLPWLAAAVLLFAALGHSARRIQDEQSEEPREIAAKSRLLPGVGAGVETLRRDSRGRYAVLATPAQSIRFYAADGKFIEEVPSAKSRHSLITDAADFDVDAQGSLFVADRGGNAVKIFDIAGKLRETIPFQAPVSLVVLSKNEFAVSGLQGNHLVEIFSTGGKLLRQFGDLETLADHAALNRFLNLGHLATDDAANVYYAFRYMPEPGVRKFAPDDSPVFDVSLRTLEFAPEALAMRREIVTQDQRENPPSFKMIINAVGVDPRSQHVWLALGSELIELDASGDRLATFRAIISDGPTLRPVSLLVDAQKLIIVDNQAGIYEFSNPGKTLPKP